MNKPAEKPYETIVGLEIHAELKTETKIFCSCKNKFGAEPNTLCCPVCAGLIGALPVLNEKVVDLATAAGLSLDCEISDYCSFDRKNYFYPDLPKAYQITQLDHPICKNGYIAIGDRRIGIERIHMEEDAGKLIHTENSKTLVDLNRCGVPLIEIVTRPDIRSGEEAKLFLEALRERLLFAGVSDCKMNEGSLRCDVNVSVRKVGTDDIGVRTEIKNLNSFAFVQKAIEYEAERQWELLSSGKAVKRETRRFDEKSGRTLSMRSKESSADYRYLTEPDLPPFWISREYVEKIRSALPKLPEERRELYKKRFALLDDDCMRLTRDINTADCFEKAASATRYPRLAANLLISSVPEGSPLSENFSEGLSALCDLLGDKKLNSSQVKELIAKMIDEGIDPLVEIERKGFTQISSSEELLPIIKQTIAENQKAVTDYLCGKQAAAKALIGRVMKATSGRADPELCAAIIAEELEKLR